MSYSKLFILLFVLIGLVFPETLENHTADHLHIDGSLISIYWIWAPGWDRIG